MGRNIFFILQLQVLFYAKANGAVCPFAMDLAFLLDSSASIKSSNYQIMKEFVNSVIDHFHVSDEGTHIGAVSFSHGARTQIRFTSNQDVDQVKASVLAIRHHKSGSRISRGLRKCRVGLFSVRNGMRSNVPRALLTITDGRISSGYSATKRESEKLKRRGVVIFAMGIGSSVHTGDLEALASQPSYSHMFQLKSRSWIPAGSDLKIALAMCSVGRTSNAVVHPVVPQHAINRHTIASHITFDDMECAFICIKHSSCYSFNFHSSSRLCELNYARKADFPIHFSYNRDSVYSELDFAPNDAM
ncbi:matrilin-4-like isoform X1 [Acropora muricata]|uniref:matrilin-4-like isoform X1 n=2 Tax=Acropora muricata TaxID=159855 RepID=UPI0034E587A6